MTDSISYLTVALEQDFREDDVECIVLAIRQLRGVLKVEKNISNPDDWLAYSRARSDLAQRVWNALEDKEDK